MWSTTPNCDKASICQELSWNQSPFLSKKEDSEENLDYVLNCHETRVHSCLEKRFLRTKRERHALYKLAQLITKMSAGHGMQCPILQCSCIKQNLSSFVMSNFNGCRIAEKWSREYIIITYYSLINGNKIHVKLFQFDQMMINNGLSPATNNNYIRQQRIAICYYCTLAMKLHMNE